MLMQLGFLGCFRWDSVTSTQRFEMMDTVDVGRVEMLKCRRFVRDGEIQTMYEKRLNPLKHQLVDALRPTLDLKTQMRVLGEVFPAGIDSTGMEASIPRLPEKVVRPDFADIEDKNDRFIARSIYLKKMEENLNILALIEMNISERSGVEFKSVQTIIPTVGLRTPYLFYWTLSRPIS